MKNQEELKTTAIETIDIFIPGNRMASCPTDGYKLSPTRAGDAVFFKIFEISPGVGINDSNMDGVVTQE